jgi:hypothetical protein
MGVVEIETRYVPVPVVLEPRETVNSKSLSFPWLYARTFVPL